MKQLSLLNPETNTKMTLREISEYTGITYQATWDRYFKYRRGEISLEEVFRKKEISLLVNPETGEPMSLKEIAEQTGITYQMICLRISKYRKGKISLEEVFRKKEITFLLENPETKEKMTITQIAKYTGFNYPTIFQRVKKYKQGKIPIEKVFRKIKVT